MASSNKIFKSFQRKGAISKKKLKYFLHGHKKATKLKNLYFLPNVHEKPFNIPGRPVIFNCGTPSENALDHQFLNLLNSLIFFLFVLVLEIIYLKETTYRDWFFSYSSFLDFWDKNWSTLHRLRKIWKSQRKCPLTLQLKIMKSIGYVI